MGLFANTLFSVLLGWVQTAASWLWSLMTNTDVHAWLRWVLDNWLVLVILLCLAGAAMDFVVYLFRWQPYRIWKSRMRQANEQNEQAENQEAEHPSVFRRKWLYADGSTEVEDVPAAPMLQTKEPSEQLTTPVRPVRRVMRMEAPEQAYHQPVYPSQWQQRPQNEQGGNE